MEKENGTSKRLITMNESIYIAGHNIVSPLGLTTEENFEKLKQGISGLALLEDELYSRIPIYASKIDDDLLDAEFETYHNPFLYTKFEKILILSAKKAIESTQININEKTLFVISSTKGNIELLDNEKRNKFGEERLQLWSSANLIKEIFHLQNEPVIISNACISGVAAIAYAKRTLLSSDYENAVIIGADILTEFVISGFQSFQAISSSPCRPFDADRDGISLGEGAGCLILTKNRENSLKPEITLEGCSFTNDANHISGPSRTGDGLAKAIENALDDSVNVSRNDIDFISAHGTATPFNDEMEALAFGLTNLTHVPLNSLKGYYGHTLGAAGVLESIITIETIRQNTLIKSIGYEKSGVSVELSVITETNTKTINAALKTASGFGGCNGALIFRKND